VDAWVSQYLKLTLPSHTAGNPIRRRTIASQRREYNQIYSDLHVFPDLPSKDRLTRHARDGRALNPPKESRIVRSMFLSVRPPGRETDGASHVWAEAPMGLDRTRARRNSAAPSLPVISRTGRSTEVASFHCFNNLPRFSVIGRPRGSTTRQVAENVGLETGKIDVFLLPMSQFLWMSLIGRSQTKETRVFGQCESPARGCKYRGHLGDLGKFHPVFRLELAMNLLTRVGQVCGGAEW